MKMLCFGWLGLALAALPLHAERLGYHEIRTDASGHIVPWYSTDLGVAYDHDLRLIWRFWQHLPPGAHGVPYYLLHQVWKPQGDPRGLGGDQLNMALSSWNLLHDYLGEPSIVANIH